ncbi:MAG: UDP-N-acetylglucosamine 2-epimerase (non-hydrolyzing) [Bacteroidales bacterium]
MKIVSVVGARPNFMKIAPFVNAITKYNIDITSVDPDGHVRHAVRGKVNPQLIEHILVHTGQHYDKSMSDSFFDELNIPEPDINLGVGSGTHAGQVGQTMIAFEKVLRAEKPDWVVVVGDVNATLACSVTAKKELVKVCHIEAGLRSGDMTMPEEINRLVTDRLSDLLLAPDMLSVSNLKAEGVPDSKIRFVGNIMIDTLEDHRVQASQLKIIEIIDRNLIKRAGGAGQSAGGQQHHFSQSDNFAVLTIHRPSNVDDAKNFKSILSLLIKELPEDLPILWPVHPRARKNMEGFGYFNEIADNPKFILLEPLGYLEMLRLNMSARIMLTDSGGLQEECTILGTPCLTLRQNTERPVTLLEHGGASVLVGNDIETIRKEIPAALNKPRSPFRPPLWDGKAAERCLAAILEEGEGEGERERGREGEGERLKDEVREGE